MISLRWGSGRLGCCGQLIFDLAAGVVIIADVVVLAAQTPHRVDVGTALFRGRIDKCRAVGHAQTIPSVFVLAEYAVLYSALYSVPLEAHAVCGALKGGDPRHINAAVGDCPALLVVIARKVAVIVDRADGVAACCADRELVVKEFGALRFNQAIPALAAARVNAVGGHAVDGVPFQPDALWLAGDLGERGGLDAAVGCFPTGFIVAAHKAALVVDTADRIDVFGAQRTALVVIGGSGKYGELCPVLAGGLAVDIVFDRVLDRVPRQADAVGVTADRGDLRCADALILDAPAVGVIVADVFAGAVDAANRVDVGLAGGNVLVEELGLFGIGDALPVVARPAEDTVGVGVLDRAPFEPYALGLTGDPGELRRARALIGVLPAGGVVLADKVALLVHTAHGIGVGGVLCHVVVNVGGVGGFLHPLPAVLLALVIYAVSDGGVIDRVLHGAPAQLHALCRALKRCDRGGVKDMIGVLCAGFIIVADEVAVFVHTAHGIGVGRPVFDVLIDIGGRRGFGHTNPVIVFVLVVDAVFVSALDRLPVDLHAVAGAGGTADLGRLYADRREEAIDADTRAGTIARIGKGVDGIVLADTRAVTPLYRVVGAAAVHTPCVGVKVAVIRIRLVARPQLCRGGSALRAEVSVTIAVEDDRALALIPVFVVVGMIQRRLRLLFAVEYHVFGAEFGAAAAGGCVDMQLDLMRL